MADSDDKVEVQIGATSDELQAGVDSATEALSAGVGQMIELLQQLVAQSAATSAEIVADEEKISTAVEESAAESSSAFTRMAEGIKEQTTELHENIEGFVGGIHNIQKAFQLIGEVAMLGFVGEQIMDLGKEFAEFGEQTAQAAQKTGQSTDAIQELNFAANQNAVSSQAMQMSMQRLSRSMAEVQQGSEQAAGAFKSVGLSADELKNMSLDEVLNKVADAFQAHADGANKAALAQQLFGRGAAQLIPVLNQGSSGIAQLREEAQQLGVVMSEQDVEAGEKLNKQFDVMDAEMSALKLRAGSELAPAMAQIATAMNDVSQKGGVLDQMFVALGVVMKSVVTAGIGVAVAFEEVAELVATTALAVNQAAHGEFSTAAATINLGLTAMHDDAEQAYQSITKLWSAASAGESIKSPGGEGGEKPQMEIQPGKDKGAADQMEMWRQQLEQQQEASGDFFKDNLKDEETFWESKLALTSAGSKNQVAVEHELYQVRSQEAHQGLADDVAAIREQYEAAHQGSEERINLANDMANRIGEAYGIESAQYKAALNESRKAALEWQAEQQSMLNDQIVQAEKASLAEIAQRSDAEKSKYKLDQESSSQETADLISLENQKSQIEMDALTKQIALYEQDSAQYRKLLDEKEKATQDHNSAVEKIAEQGSQQTQQKWTQAFRQIDNNINQSIMGMIRGTTTLSQAVTRTAEQMLGSMVNSILQIVERWVAGEAEKVIASEGTSKIMQALGLEDAATSQVTQSATATTEVASQAAVAAAGAFAATAAIPYVGPALAPAAAAEAYSSVMAFESMASAAGGYYQVPSDQFAQIHKDEMVLPAWAASGMRDMLGAGAGAPAALSSAGGSGGHTFNFNTTLNGNTDASFKAMLSQHRDVITSGVLKQLRNAQRS